jgi:hypothetical protein
MTWQTYFGLPPAAEVRAGRARFLSSVLYGSLRRYARLMIFILALVALLALNILSFYSRLSLKSVLGALLPFVFRPVANPLGDLPLTPDRFYGTLVLDLAALESSAVFVTPRPLHHPLLRFAASVAATVSNPYTMGTLGTSSNEQDLFVAPAFHCDDVVLTALKAHPNDTALLPRCKPVWLGMQQGQASRILSALRQRPADAKQLPLAFVDVVGQTDTFDIPKQVEIPSARGRRTVLRHEPTVGIRRLTFGHRALATLATWVSLGTATIATLASVKHVAAFISPSAWRSTPLYHSLAAVCAHYLEAGTNLHGQRLSRSRAEAASPLDALLDLAAEADADTDKEAVGDVLLTRHWILVLPGPFSLRAPKALHVGDVIVQMARGGTPYNPTFRAVLVSRAGERLVIPMASQIQLLAFYATIQLRCRAFLDGDRNPIPLLRDFPSLQHFLASVAASGVRLPGVRVNAAPRIPQDHPFFRFVFEQAQGDTEYARASAAVEPEPEQDHYAVLGVEPGAEAADIKKAYRRLVVKLHPDKNDASDAAEQFRSLQIAYETLSDFESRRVYDARRGCA